MDCPGFRYKAKLVQDQAYLEQLFAYVHLNPVAAGLVDDPALYLNSGHLEILGGRPSRLVDCRSALSIFALDGDEARQRYSNLVRNLAEVRWIREGVRKLPWWKDIANDHQLVTEDEAPAEATLFDGEPLPSASPMQDLAKSVARFEKHRGLSIGDLGSRCQDSIITRERQLLTLCLARQRLGTHRELADLLGRNPSSISRWLNRAVELNIDDSTFHDDLAEAESAVVLAE